LLPLQAYTAFIRVPNVSIASKANIEAYTV